MATNDNLTIDIVHKVQDALWEARAKWPDIGPRIGVDAGTLASIRGDDGKCLTDMLKHWLRGVYKPDEPNSKPRTWRTLIDVLGSKVVNEGELAKRLEQEKYPQDVSPKPSASQPEQGGQPPVNPAGHGVYFGQNRGKTFTTTILNVGGNATVTLPGQHATQAAAPGNHRPFAPQPTPSQQPGKRMAIDGDQDLDEQPTGKRMVTRTDGDEDQQPIATCNELQPLGVDEMSADTNEQITNMNSKLLPPKQLKVYDIHTIQQLQGQGVEIAILDTGIHANHDVFKTKERKDIQGYDFFENNGDEKNHGDKKSSWKKPGLHGTAVAAVAAGNEYMNQGQPGKDKHLIAGIAPQAKLYICRISDGTKYPWECLIKALDHLIGIKMKEPDRIDIVVMSFGSKSKPDNVNEKLGQLADKGVILIAAGGNEGGWQSDNDFPASSKHVISVGAFTLDARKAAFATDHAHVYTPGDHIVVPSLESTTNVCRQNGTSFAAPMLAGFLALFLQCVKQKYPEMMKKYPIVKEKYPTEEDFMKKFHDDDFLRGILRSHLLVHDKMLLHAGKFLEDLDPKRIFDLRLIDL